MTTYILIVYLWAGGKLAYPFRFPSLEACQVEASEQMSHTTAVAGTVCLETNSPSSIRVKR